VKEFTSMSMTMSPAGALRGKGARTRSMLGFPTMPGLGNPMPEDGAWAGRRVAQPGLRVGAGIVPDSFVASGWASKESSLKA